VADGGVAATAGADGAGWDFFVSYTQVDREWAEWIAWTLEEAGYRVLVQAWDFVPGTNWVHGMQDGVIRASRTVAVLSTAYAGSVYGSAEWQAAWSADPTGAQRKLLVARVENCARSGVLGQVVSFDLFGMAQEQAREDLLRYAGLAVSGKRAKPQSPPSFPSGRAAAPGSGSGSAASSGAPAAADPASSGPAEEGVRQGDRSVRGQISRLRAVMGVPPSRARPRGPWTTAGPDRRSCARRSRALEELDPGDAMRASRPSLASLADQPSL